VLNLICGRYIYSMKSNKNRRVTRRYQSKRKKRTLKRNPTNSDHQWIKTSWEQQLPPIPVGATMTWFLDKDVPLQYGALTHHRQPTHTPPTPTPRGAKYQSYHMILFRTEKEREQYWDNTETVWGETTRFFVLKHKIKIDSVGQWYVFKPLV
jgi:hypothetical protein